jgi:hypothetical protein
MASGVMVIHYGSNDILRAAKGVANEFSDARDRLNTINNRVLSIRENSSRSYLSNASYFIKLKRAQYERKNEQALRFASRADAFLEQCKDTDARVATHIEQSYKFFKRVTGIGKSAIAALFDKLWKGIKGIAKALFVVLTLPLWAPLAQFFAVIRIADVIVRFYNKYKEQILYIIKAAWAFIKCVVAVVALLTITATGIMGVIAAVGAVILLVDAFVGVVRSWGAAYYSMTGRLEDARELDSMSNGEMFGSFMEGCGFGSDEYWTSYYNITQIIGTACFLVGSISKFATEVYKGGKIIGYWDAFKSKTVDKLFSFKLDLQSIINFGSDFANNTDWYIRLNVLNVGPAVKAFKGILGLSETLIFKNIGIFKDFASGNFNSGKVFDQLIDIFVPFGGNFNKMYKLINAI